MPDLPKPGDKVWVESRYLRGTDANGWLLQQPNGIVHRIRKWDNEVDVDFYGDMDTVALDSFEGTFTERFGGVWMVQ